MLASVFFHGICNLPNGGKMVRNQHIIAKSTRSQVELGKYSDEIQVIPYTVNLIPTMESTCNRCYLITVFQVLGLCRQLICASFDCV